MTTNRRSFLGTALSGIALTASGSLFSSFTGESESSANRKHSSRLKISCQEGVSPGKELSEKLDFMESLEIVGVEFGGRGLEKRVNEIQQALQNRNMKVSAICAGFEGWLISSDRAIQKKCMDSMKVIIEAAGELGSTGVIFVPAFNNQVSLPDKEARELLIGQMKELGDFALQNKTRIILEPLNREECYFCRQVADGAAIVRDANSAGAAVMGDFWHMTREETNDRGAFISAGDYLHHVHIASRKHRKMPGEDGEADNYINGFRGLKEINYQDYVSFECGSIGDSKITLPAAVKLMREQWKKA
ncbi:MAG TPA: sugar phosphate isomerase/epimerase family protein [Prolixibacteraceae bacterium]|nr:sugar phosphate isomerase/epimerase family protein [Prolixibacteraceae bacterium]